MDKKNNLVWIDLEMSGLNPETDVILEIATIITDSSLNVLEEGPVIAINQPDSILDNMDEWNSHHHKVSGLIRRVRESQITLAMAEEKTVEFIKKYTEKGKSPLCGNSIGQDRRFLYKYMPALTDQLHYRNIDVSSIKELSYRWYQTLPQFQKAETHKALDDIRESIDEMKYYKSLIFKKPEQI